ncbi:MAG: hypothetical protein JNM63_13120 [Spirochaetia bacterium]|nr:hypothetical protein [Spirochaetia bacterium]
MFHLQGEWRPAEKDIGLDLAGNLFENDWLAENVPDQKTGGDASDPISLHGHFEIERVNWGGLRLNAVSADAGFHSPKWEWTKASFDYQGQKIGLDGAYDTGEKKGVGFFGAESFDLKILETYLADSNQSASVDGKVSVKGAYEWSPRGFLVNADFESLGSVALANSSYQKKIWRLPFISSKKSTEDLFQGIAGGFHYQGSDSGKNLDLKNIRFLSEEFAFRFDGQMAVGKPDWKFDLEFLFSDYFMNQHIIWNEGLKRFARLSAPEDPFRMTNGSLTHTLGLALEKKAGEFRYVLK